MKNWEYPKKCIVQVNDNAKDMSGEIGKYGSINGKLNTPLYDYEVKLETGNTGKFKESELDYFFKQGDILEVISSGELGEVCEFDLKYKQVELEHDDRSHKVYLFSQVQQPEVKKYIGGKLVEDDNVSELKTVQLTNADLHRKILETLHQIYVTKNADYGNSFEEQFKEYGKLSGVIRIDDKVRRLKQLLKQLAQVKDESFEDTLYDLANYSIMLLMELIKEKEGELNAER